MAMYMSAYSRGQAKRKFHKLFSIPLITSGMEKKIMKQAPVGKGHHNYFTYNRKLLSLLVYNNKS